MKLTKKHVRETNEFLASTKEPFRNSLYLTVTQMIEEDCNWSDISKMLNDMGVLAPSNISRWSAEIAEYIFTELKKEFLDLGKENK